MTVLLATFDQLPEGEPGHELLDDELRARGLDHRWEVWSDGSVDWAGADLVAVRATWDYVERHSHFLEWAHEVEQSTTLLNGADVFAWNLDKSYLVRLHGEDRVPTVPTVVVDSLEDLEAARADHGDLVVKPRVGAGGVGVVVVRRDEPLEDAALPAGPLVAQPLVPSVRTEGELSVFVIDGRPVSMVRKVPAGDEIRVHEHLGGRYGQVPLEGEPAELAGPAMEAAAAFAGRPLDYGRVDLLHHEGRWRVSELEVTEPSLYLDVFPDNAAPFAELVQRRLGS